MTTGERAVADVARVVRGGTVVMEAVKKGNDAAENLVCGGVSWLSCVEAFLLGLACVEKLVGSRGRNLNLNLILIRESIIS